MILPDDLYDYADDRRSSHGASHGSDEEGARIGHIAVIDDWPENVPVTEAEVDIFERYFGDLLDRLFDLSDRDRQNEGLCQLTSDVNYRA